MSPTRTFGMDCLQELRRGCSVGRACPPGALLDRGARAHLAGDPVPRRDLLERLLVLGAGGHAERAARVEAAPGGRIDRAWDIAIQQDSLSLHGGIGYRNRGE